MRTITLLVILLALAGCSNPEKVAEYEARQAEAIAAQQRASADQSDAEARQATEEARKAMYENETQRFDILADAIQPNYWPMIILSIVMMGGFIYVVRMMLLAQNHQMAMLASRQEPRLLPGDLPFSQVRRLAAQQGCEVEVRYGEYWLIDELGNERKIKGLIGGQR